MQTVVEPRDARLSIRCGVQEKALIECAAAAAGLSVSDYIRSVAIERSLNEIQRLNRILVSQEAFAQLADLLEADSEPPRALVENLGRYREAITSGALTVAD